MGRQSRLVLTLLLAIGVLQVALSSTPLSLDIEHDDLQSNDLESAEQVDLRPNVGIKISTPKVKELPIVSSTSTTASAKKSAQLSSSTTSTSTTHKPVSDEVLNDLIEASKHSLALADDPRFNKMLPDKFKLENATSTNKSEENYDEYDNYDYDDDYNYDDESTSPEPMKKSKSGTPKSITGNLIAPSEKKVELKSIKEDDKKTSKDDHQKLKNDINAIDNADDDDDDDDADYNEDDDDDDIADEEEIIFNENVPCPRYCVCARNINSYLVATCSRFDPGTQKFGSDITDLVVTDVGPKYPILLGPDFFLKMGLKHVSSIKISNCTIEYLHPNAFHGLDELYSVNLTNVGLAIINPNTFSTNKKLRILTISGNDLSVMSSVHYFLNSSSIEELDLSRNNLMELNPNAFSQLSNIVYINLSQNNLEKIPDKVFDSVETIEELDLSYNTLKSLPTTIFNRTALAILHLKYNSITGELHFGTEDLQQLDLSFNSINQIHHGMFDKMVGLTNLNLKGNGITKIQADSFLTLKNLRHIDLSINELDQVSSMMFFKNSELDVIRLNDNPRLSQLPTDGFLSYNGYFTAYYLDVSNCAIGALGHKTFSTMPHLTTLKLAWNNINNLEHDTFASLTKLIDLDLSNNLIARLDELTFMNNNELTKLNLAGNPIRKLSVRIFLPMSKLRELDVSDCELTSLLTDNQYGVGRKYKFYETLRSFNASANQIKRISSADVKNFKNLRTLDISHNPLKCNEDFQDFVSYVSLNSTIVTNKIPNLANIETVTTFVEYQPHAGWANLAHEVCKHQEGMLHKSKDNKLDKRLEQADKDLDDDAKNLLNIMEKNKRIRLQKIIKDSRKSEIIINDDHLGDEFDEEVNEDDLNTAEEDKNSEEENASDYDDGDDGDDDDDDDQDQDDTDGDYDTFDKKHDKKVDRPKMDGLSKETMDKILNELNREKINMPKLDEIELNKEAKDKIWMNEFILNGKESPDDSSEEEIIIHHIYDNDAKFILQTLLAITSLIIITTPLALLIRMVMRKRGERDRMALLASSNNSIVYQKLTEDIKQTAKESKQPKVHRYSIINQV